MPLGMKVQASPSFARTVGRFRVRSDLIMGATLRGLTISAARAARTEARVQLKDLVYTAPLPPSAYGSVNSQTGEFIPRDPQQYLEKRRVGLVWRAVKTREIGGAEGFGAGGRAAAAETFVDQSDFPAFYYARILNGYHSDGSPVATTINYPPRPFWTITARMMKIRFKIMGRTALRKMRGGFAGAITGLAELEAIES